MVTIEGMKDRRVVKCILHRVADIPGGVTVSVVGLGGSAVVEGTPLGRGTNGMYVVCKTARVLNTANATSTTYDVNKGSHFNVGDRFATDGANGQTIASIDRSREEKDVITLSATLGVEVKAGTCAFESAGANKTLKVVPVAIAGDNLDVKAGNNLYENAWVHAVIREENAPAVTDKIKDALRCVTYV